MSRIQGKVIDKATAKAEIEQYLKIRNNTYTDVNATVGGKLPISKKYFSDKEISFVFEKSLIEGLLALASQKGANCVRIYYGAALDTDANPGSSTLVIIPAQLTYDGNGEIIKVENKLYSDNLAGVEYPGGCILDDTTKVTIDIDGDVLTSTTDFM